MMTLREALLPVAANRGDAVVITTMASVGVWPELSDRPKDFAYLPSSMGQAVPLGLGLALAKPGLPVIVVSGDGGLLMNLGCLVTLAAYAVPVRVVVIDNGLYEVTGGQPVPGAGTTDFPGLAKAAGIVRSTGFAAAADWSAAAAGWLTGPGPAFIALKVTGERGKPTPSAPRPMREQISRLLGAVGPR